jgi:hypothetical protein
VAEGAAQVTTLQENHSPVSRPVDKALQKHLVHLAKGWALDRMSG